MLERERDFTPVTTSVVDRHVLARGFISSNLQAIYDGVFDLDPSISMALIDNSTNEMLFMGDASETSDAFFYLERDAEDPEDFFQWISDFEPGYTTLE
jgi:hypothetical protein